MAIDEIKIKNEDEEKDFDDEWEDDTTCECCGLPFDQCSWGKPDEWDDYDENDDDSQINDPDYRPEYDSYEYSYSDSDSEV